MSWLNDAIAAGIRLLRQRLGTEVAGYWRDFALPGMSAGSTECVSAFIAAQIGAIPEGRELATTVVGTIVSHPRETGGWGYRVEVPEDCDSTAWVLLAAAAADVDLPPPVVAHGARFIVAHQRDGGGFATYGPAAKAYLTPADQPGWFAPEVSVTSSAVLALATTGTAEPERLQRARHFLSRNRREGLWESYWWRGFGYATFLSLLALSAAGRGHYEDHLAIAEQAILARRGAAGGWENEPGTGGNGFSTSLALRSLLLIDRGLTPRDTIMESIAYLSGLATATGMFPPSAEMLAPGALNGSDAIIRDNGTVTTACVIRALHEARSSLGKHRSF